MGGIPGPFARDYAYQQMITGGSSRALFDMTRDPRIQLPPTNIPMVTPTARPSRYQSLPPVQAPGAYQPPAPAAASYGVPQGAPISPFNDGLRPFAQEYAQQAFQADYAAEGQRQAAAAVQTEPTTTEGFGGLSPAQIQNVGMHAASAGALVAVIGVIGNKIASKENLKAQARTLQHEAFITNLNARIAERQASSIEEQGRLQIAQMTAQAGQVKAQQETRAGARGVVIGEGSAGEVTATTDIAKEVEMLAINRAAVERASAVRRQGVSLRGRSLLSSVSAGNLNRSAGNIRPGIAGGAQFISSLGQFAGRYASYRRGIQ